MKLDELVPDARRVVAAAGEVYERCAGPHFVGLVVHGSAVKGDVIPGGSDIDFMLYLADGAFDDGGGVRADLALATREALQTVDVAPFRFLQCFPKRTHLVPGDPFQETGPYPGTWTLVSGALPVPVATADQVRERALRQLRGLRDTPPGFTNGLLSAGDRVLHVQVSTLRSTVWSAYYALLTLLSTDPLAPWALGKPEAIGYVDDHPALAKAIREFHRAQVAYFRDGLSSADALAMVRAGFASLAAMRAVFRDRASE